jgi:endonuclease/exonuclease/phosphatase family metal-dependent hydrolase
MAAPASSAAIAAASTPAAAASPHPASAIPRLSVMTFNLLCPAYKRCATESGTRYREAIKPEEWNARLKLILDGLRQADVDIICLQEYWTTSREWHDQFVQALPNYRLFVTPRTGGKDDGVAVFLRAKPSATHGYVCTVVTKHDVQLQGFGNRVALLLQVQAAAAQDDHASDDHSAPQPPGWSFHEAMEMKLGAAASSNSPKTVASFDFFLLVTHLTFNHGIFDSQQRKFEISSLFNQLDAIRFRDKKEDNVRSSYPVIVTGDFNTQLQCTTDYVYQKALERGYTSAFARVNEREPGVTHRNHRGECVPVDFCFYSQPDDPSGLAPRLTPIFSTLLPANDPDQTWPADFTLSDHRPVLTVFEVTRGGEEAVVQAATGDSPTAKEKRAAL